MATDQRRGRRLGHFRAFEGTLAPLIEDPHSVMMGGVPTAAGGRFGSILSRVAARAASTASCPAPCDGGAWASACQLPASARRRTGVSPRRCLYAGNSASCLGGLRRALWRVQGKYLQLEDVPKIQVLSTVLRRMLGCWTRKEPARNRALVYGPPTNFVLTAHGMLARPVLGPARPGTLMYRSQRAARICRSFGDLRP